jgi:hypothetical protein
MTTTCPHTNIPIHDPSTNGGLNLTFTPLTGTDTWDAFADVELAEVQRQIFPRSGAANAEPGQQL